MNIALGMIVAGDVGMLDRTVRCHAGAFKVRAAIDTGANPDASEYLCSRHGFSTRHVKWESDFSKARNQLIAYVEQEFPECEWVLMLDSDEAMFERDALEIATHPGMVGYLPRVHVAGETMDRWYKTECRTTYPDLQGRLIPLRSGVSFVNRIHEVPVFNGDSECAYSRRLGFPIEQHIYHYGLCRPLPELWLKEENRRREMSGVEKLTSVPLGIDFGDPFSGMPELEINHPLK